MRNLMILLCLLLTTTFYSCRNQPAAPSPAKAGTGTASTLATSAATSTAAVTTSLASQPAVSIWDTRDPIAWNKHHLDFPDFEGELPACLSIRVEAGSWKALVAKVRPTLTWAGSEDSYSDAHWGGRDMMWAERDKSGRLVFRLERAFTYKPTGKPAKWVLVTYKDDERPWPWQLDGNSLPARCPLARARPKGYSNCAFAVASKPNVGTVYEIGWLPTVFSAQGEYVAGRQIFVLKQPSGRYLLLGETVDTTGRVSIRASTETCFEHQVVWTGQKGAPVLIEVTQTNWKCPVWGGDQPAPPDWRICRDGVLDPDAEDYVRWKDHCYVVAQGGDTLEKIAGRLAYWDSDLADENYRRFAKPLWEKHLRQLNPGLVAKDIAAGTHVSLDPEPIEGQIYDEFQKDSNAKQAPH